VTATRRAHWKPIATAALAAMAVAGLGAWVTQLGPWYYGLREPAWKPPDWLFGPAWTLIFALSAIAGALAWRAAKSSHARLLIVGLFAVNINLNILWSGLFFRLQRPDYAFAEVGLLWLSIVALIVFLRRYSTMAAWLLVPYLAWVTFAGALNHAVVRLNGPFTDAWPAHRQCGADDDRGRGVPQQSCVRHAARNSRSEMDGGRGDIT